MTPFDDRLYEAFRTAPAWTDVCDQWSEHGWLYDEATDRLVEYAVDRKAQSHDVIRTRSRADFEADILPRAKASLKKWYAKALPPT